MPSAQRLDSFGPGNQGTSSKELEFPYMKGPGLYRPQGYQSLTKHSVFFTIIMSINAVPSTHVTEG